MLACAAPACQARTELVFGVVTDVRAPDVLDTIQLQVTRADNGFVEQQVSWDISGKPDLPFNLPGSYGVYSDGDETQLDVVLTGLKSNHVVVTRHAILSLVEGHTLFFRMGLTAGCIARTDCADTESCIEGVCRDVHVDSRQLPPFSKDIVDHVTCNSGTAYLETATGEPMPPSDDAADCDPALCVEGTCLKPPVVDDTPRTVTGQQITVFANGSGTIDQPDDLTTLAPRALIPDGSGGFTEIDGTGSADGTFSIPGVPGGEYYLAIGSAYYVTSASTLDLSTVVNGRPGEMAASNATSLTLNVTNLEPWQQTDLLEAYAADANTFWFDVANRDESATLAVPIADNTTALSSYTFTDQFAHDLDQSANLIQGDPFVVTQLRHETSGGLPYLSAERTFVAAPFTQTNGRNTVVAGAFTDVPQQDLTVNVAVTQLDGVTGFDGTHLTALGSRAVPILGAIESAALHRFSILGLPGGPQFGNYGNSADFMFFEPPSGADLTALQLTYGLAIPPGETYGVLYDVNTRGITQLALPGTSQPANLSVSVDSYGELAALPATLAYPLGPPAGATIGGHSLFDDQQILASATLAWSPPAIGRPTQYTVTVFELVRVQATTTQTQVATVVTHGTTLTLPPGVLQVGHFYAITLSARLNVRTPDAPNRLSSPGADVQIASGLLTVIDGGGGGMLSDAGATGPDGGGGVPIDAPGGAVCAVPSSFAPSLGSDQQAIHEGVTNGQDQVTWFGPTNSLPNLPDAQLRLFIFSGGTGSAATPDWPGALGPKTGVDLAMSPDAVAVIVGDFSGSNNAAQTIYLAQAGTLNLNQAGSAAGAQFAGTVVDGDFIHVTQNGDGTLNVAPDGCESSVPSFAFNAIVQAGSSGFAAGPARDVPVDALRALLRHRTR